MSTSSTCLGCLALIVVACIGIFWYAVNRPTTTIPIEQAPIQPRSVPVQPLTRDPEPSPVTKEPVKPQEPEGPESTPASRSLESLARNHEINKNRDKAIAAYEELIAKHPDTVEGIAAKEHLRTLKRQNPK